MISLSRIVAYWAEQRPDAPAITHDQGADGARAITWAELEARSNRLARAYAQLGVGVNDFVTIALPNSIAFFESSLAVWKLGATPQPVSANLPVFERNQIIELAAPKLVVGAQGGVPGDVACIPIGFEPDATLSGEPLPEATANSFKAMTSGGSTGRPKLIVAANRAEWDPDSPFLGFGARGVFLIPGPLYHNGPFMWAMLGLFKGNSVVITSRFDAEQTLALIERHHVDTVYTVPTMMQRMWNLPTAVRTQYDVSSLQVLWHLAAPCPPWLKEAFIEWLGAEVIWELYGGTEGLGSTVIRGDEWLAHKGSVGKPGETCEMKVVDEAGNTMPPGELGEIFIRPRSGVGTTYRYIGAQAKSMDGGWESLGDIGYLDEEGYLYLSDRLTDMVLTGGANVYPAEVEAAIDAFPGVRSSAVIGLPHEDLGNAVHGIVDAPGGDVTERALLDHLEQRLARYKIPRTLEFVDEPLRDDAGKVRRKALRQARLSGVGSE